MTTEPDQIPISEKAQLGYASTAQLLNELRVRGMVDLDRIHGRVMEVLSLMMLENLPQPMLDYATVGTGAIESKPEES